MAYSINIKEGFEFNPMNSKNGVNCRAKIINKNIVTFISDIMIKHLNDDKN